MTFASIDYSVTGRIATLTLNRPERLNAIDDGMPGEIRAAAEAADRDDSVYAVVLTGAGRSFCAGYDLTAYAEGSSSGIQEEMPWDPLTDFRFMKRNTDDFMALWRCSKPVIAKVRGHAVAGGSDIALCADLIVMAEDARIGYPPTRVWGCPTTAMWVYRLGPERAKRMLLTGDLIDGRTAADWGLACSAVPADRLDDEVAALAERIAAVPRNQLAMQKLVVNQAIEAMGLAAAQTLATTFDGITRHSAEGFWFKRYAETAGWHEAVAWRDSGRPIPDGAEARRALADFEERR